MKYVTATKKYPVCLRAVADGSGLWEMQEGCQLRFSEVEVEINFYPGSQPSAYVTLKHDKDAMLYGLPYTDNGVENSIVGQFPLLGEMGSIVTPICGSEQGMQERFSLNMDATVVDSSITPEALQDMGFNVYHGELF